MNTRTFYLVIAVVGAGLLAFGLYASRDVFVPPASIEVPAAEPSVSDGPLLTYSDDIVTFNYPEKLSTTYIRAIDWPPKVAATKESISCEAGETEIGMTKIVIAQGREYCVTTQSEGAAGSMYTDYTYTTEKDSKVITVTFTLRLVQCGNYNEPERSLCERERTTFDVTALIDRIVGSATSH